MKAFTTVTRIRMKNSQTSAPAVSYLAIREESAPPAKKDITPKKIYEFICFTGYSSRKFS